MNKDNSALHKVTLITASCFCVILLIVILSGIYKQNWEYVFMSLLIAVLIALPFAADRYVRKKNFIIPGVFKIVYMIFIFLTVFLGDTLDLYKKYFWWDDALHFLAGILLFILGVYIIHVVNIREKGTTITSSFFIALFAFSITLMLGSLWELAEFFSDEVLGTDEAQSGLMDTMMDMFMNTLGAIFAGSVYYFKRVKRIKNMKLKSRE